MGKRARTEQAKQARAQAILEKAKEMLLTTSYEQIKMADLAKSLGLSNGTLYVYFPSKEALFLQLLWQEFEDRMKCLERQASLCPLRSFADLQDLILRALDRLMQDRPLFIYLETMRIMVLESSLRCDAFRPERERLKMRLDGWVDQLAAGGVLSRAQLQEIFRTAVALLAGFYLRGRVWRLAGGAAPSPEAMRNDVLTGMRCYLEGYALHLQPQAGKLKGV